MSVSSVVVVTGGTGYYYPPYVVPYPVYGYPIYYPPPYTYGYVAHYHSATGAYGISQTAYGPYGSATRTASYNPYTGTYARPMAAPPSGRRTIRTPGRMAPPNRVPMRTGHGEVPWSRRGGRPPIRNTRQLPRAPLARCRRPPAARRWARAVHPATRPLARPVAATSMPAMTAMRTRRRIPAGKSTITAAGLRFSPPLPPPRNSSPRRRHRTCSRHRAASRPGSKVLPRCLREGANRCRGCKKKRRTGNEERNRVRGPRKCNGRVAKAVV
jgi:hypothetical protein